MSSFFDRFQEPEIDEPVAYDWKGQEIYKGETVYRINEDYVFPGDMLDYAENSLGAKEVSLA